MNFDFTDDQQEMIQAVREFARGEIAPRAAEMDEKAFIPEEIIGQMRELGIFGAGISTEYGGLGLDAVTYCGIIEELSQVCAGVAIMLGVHNSVAAYPLMKFGSETQKRKFLPGLAAGEIGAFCLSEPHAGSDAGSISTAAKRDGDHYVLKGQKVFVTNGKIARYYLVMARTDTEVRPQYKGISAFLVDRQESPGLVLGRKEDKMGLLASDTMEIFFEDCRVPVASRIGEEGEGFKIAMSSLDNGRIGVGSQAVGIAHAALDAAVSYAKQRQQFGKPIIHFQAIQSKFADMKTRLEAARMLVRYAAWRKDQGLPLTLQAAQAKVFASEAATWITHQAVQVHGGYGFMKEFPVERYYRDARVTEIYEGTSEMQRLVIARQLLQG